MKKVAIVGSEEKYWTSRQRTDVVKKIKEIFFVETDRVIESTLDKVIKSEEYRKTLFWHTFDRCRDSIILVSGGCPKGGVDIWAELVADVLGIEKEIYPPDVLQWDDYIEYDDSRINPPIHMKGYKSRNIEIAEVCDVLYCIDPYGRGEKTGGKWTMRYAQKLGKEIHLVEIE